MATSIHMWEFYPCKTLKQHTECPGVVDMHGNLNRVFRVCSCRCHRAIAEQIDRSISAKSSEPSTVRLRRV